MSFDLQKVLEICYLKSLKQFLWCVRISDTDPVGPVTSEKSKMLCWKIQRSISMIDIHLVGFTTESLERQLGSTHQYHQL